MKDPKVVVWVQVHVILPFSWDVREQPYYDHLNEVVFIYKHRGDDSIFISGSVEC